MHSICFSKTNYKMFFSEHLNYIYTYPPRSTTMYVYSYVKFDLSLICNLLLSFFFITMHLYILNIIYNCSYIYKKKINIKEFYSEGQINKERNVAYDYGYGLPLHIPNNNLISISNKFVSTLMSPHSNALRHFAKQLRSLYSS